MPRNGTGYISRSFFHSFDRERREGIITYKRFISMESPEEINRIFSQSKFPSVLGSESFVEKVKDNFFHKKRHDEIPESRRLAPDAEKIKKAICRAYGIEESSLLSSRRGVLNEPRNVAIFLVRRLRGEKLEEIGRQFGISKYSSVSSVVNRTGSQLRTESRLKKSYQQIYSSLTMLQAKTPYIL